MVERLLTGNPGEPQGEHGDEVMGVSRLQKMSRF